MIRVSDLRLPVDHTDDALRRELCRLLGIKPDELLQFKVIKRSPDARQRSGVNFHYIIDASVKEEARHQARWSKLRQIEAAPDTAYHFDLTPRPGPADRPIIVGTGPCGLFCGLILARLGWKPILLERGMAAGPRAKEVMAFWRSGGTLDPDNNTQFGEGGAGTFSDGKLYTRIKDKANRMRFLLDEMVAHGAPEDILTNGRPHIGTDRLIKMVTSIRKEMESLGAEFRFSTRVTDLIVSETPERQVLGVKLSDGSELRSGTVVMAVGHSARDIFSVLHTRGVFLEQKSFSVGLRIEHPQALVDKARWGCHAGNPALGAAYYSHSHHASNGRACYTFCMCPGGLVVAAASEPNHLVTNGMSSYSRSESNANTALMVEILPSDYDTAHPLAKELGPGHPLAGIHYQRWLEERAFKLGGSNYHAPVQMVGDFLTGKTPRPPMSVVPSYRPGVTPAQLSDCLPAFVTQAIREGITAFDQDIPGYAHPEAVLTGVETRSSSPIRVTRDDDSLQSLNTPGLYPGGEGAGYAGGIISAAVDGMKIAEAIAGRFAPCSATPAS